MAGAGLSEESSCSKEGREARAELVGCKVGWGPALAHFSLQDKRQVYESGPGT